MKGAICPTTGKIRYASESKAVGPDTTVGIYFCAYCEGFHRTRAKNWPSSARRAEGIRASAARRKNFGTLPLASRLDPDVIEKLRRIAEGE